MSPQTPTGSNTYQVNVNRTKTKKWVEAKVQSYDGDDWGADENDDDEPEPMPAPPLPKPPVHAAGSRKPSLPSIQTEQPISGSIQPAHAKSLSPPVVLVENSSSTRTSDDLAETSPPHVTNFAPGSYATISQSQPCTTAQAKEAALSGDGKPGKSAPLPETYRDKKAESEEGRQFADVVDSSLSPDKTEPQVEVSRHIGYEPQLLSTSPKLPDVARMSAFGTDLFSSNGGGFAVGKSPIKQWGGSYLDSSIAESEPTPASSIAEQKAAVADIDEKKLPTNRELAAAAVQSPVSVKQTSAIYPTSKSTEFRTRNITPPISSTVWHADDPTLGPEAGVDRIAPLRTPSPRAPTRSLLENFPPEPVSAPTQRDVSIHNVETSHGTENEPINLRQTTIDTTSSSPVKDNDMLSDEILKSLSSDGTPPTSFSRQPGSTASSEQGGAKLRDREELYESPNDTTKSPGTRANVAPVSEVSGKEDVSISQASVSPTEKATELPVSPQSSTLRRRFSWEAEEQASQAQAQQHSGSTTNHPEAPGVKEKGDGRQHSSAVLHIQPWTESTNADDKTLHDAGVPPQLSIGSSQPKPGFQPLDREVFSPISSESHDDSTPARAMNPLSLANEKSLHHTDISLASSTPTSEHHPTLIGQTGTIPSPVTALPPLAPVSSQPHPQALGFREIMSLDSPKERIAKYNEAREILLSTESGLQNWLIQLRNEYPDIVTGPISSLPGSRQANPGANAASHGGANSPSSQQPYYQQFLNASSTITAAPPTSRSRLAGLPLPGQTSGSTFGHSGGQIGTKSKEFMQSAGKMGKGLLSKGRSKLRGTGDKGEAVPPSDPPKITKAYRRTSWALSLGLKFRGNDDAPQQHSNANVTDGRPPPSAQSTIAAPEVPQIPYTAPLSPLHSAGQSELMLQWRRTALADVDLRNPIPPSHSQSAHPSRATAGLSKLEILNSASLLSTGAHSAPLLSWPHVWIGQDVELCPKTKDQPDDECVTIPGDGFVQHEAPGQIPAGETKYKEAFPLGLGPEDSGIGLSQHHQQDGESKRNSSFIGLAPIQHGSTSAFSSKTKACRATDRFPIEDDKNGLTNQGKGNTVDAILDNEATLQPRPCSSSSSMEPGIPAVADVSEGHITGPEASSERDNDAVIVSHLGAAPGSLKREAERQVHQLPLSKARLGDYEGNGGQVLVQPVCQMQNSEQILHSSQRLPASGRWKLEESKLTEPLNLVARNRSGTGSSLPLFMYGCEKDMGMISPGFSTQSSLQQQLYEQQIINTRIQYHTRNSLVSPSLPPSLPQRSDVPPLSAQRWPELFAYPPDQRPRSNSRDGPQPHQSSYQEPSAHNEVMMPRSRTNDFYIADVGVSEKERGQRNRSSGLLKDLGQKLTRATLCEHRKFMNQYQTPTKVSSNEVSESGALNGSGTHDRNGLRPSSFFGISGRKSVDQDPRHQFGTREDKQYAQESQSPDTPRRAERRGSMFPAALTGKLGTSGIARNSQSNLNASEDAQPKPQPQPQTQACDEAQDAKKKKKVSSLAKMPMLLGRNRRGERHVSAEPLDEPHETPAALSRGLNRSGTAGSLEAGSQHRFGYGKPGRRERRQSVSGLINGIFGKRFVSKSKPVDTVNSLQTQSPQASTHCLGVETHPLAKGPESSESLLFNPPLRNAGQRNSVYFGSGITWTQPLQPLARKGVNPCSEGDCLQELDLREGKESRQSNAESQSPHQRPDQEAHKSALEPPTTGIHGVADASCPNTDDTDGKLARPSSASLDLSMASDRDATEHRPDDQILDHSAEDLVSNFKEDNDITAAAGTNAKTIADSAITKPHPKHQAYAVDLPALSSSEQTGQSVEEPVHADLTEPYRETRPQLGQGAPVRKDVNSQQQAFRQRLAGPVGYKQNSPQIAYQSHQEYQNSQASRQFQSISQEQQGEVMTSPDHYPQAANMNIQDSLSQSSGAACELPRQVIQPHQVRDSSGLKWKSLTRRVSEQMMNVGQKNTEESKPEKAEKDGGNRILDAFRRSSKQSDTHTTAPIQVDATCQPDFQQQMTQLQEPVSQQSDTSYILTQYPPQKTETHPQLQQRPQNSNDCSVPQKSVYGQHSSLSVPVFEGHQAYFQEYLSQEHGEEWSFVQAGYEPQYDAVPIPRGYNTVHGEGTTVSTAYSIGRHHNPPIHQFPTQQQSAFAAQQRFRTFPQQQVSPLTAHHKHLLQGKTL